MLMALNVVMHLYQALFFNCFLFLGSEVLLKANSVNCKILPLET